AITVPVIRPPWLPSAATTRNSRVTDSPGRRPRSLVQTTVVVPPGQLTVSPWAPFRRTSGSWPYRSAAGIAATPGGRFSVATTGSDTVPPEFRTVIGRSAGAPPAAGRAGPGAGGA